MTVALTRGACRSTPSWTPRCGILVRPDLRRSARRSIGHSGCGRRWQHATSSISASLMTLLPSMQELGLNTDDHVHVAMSGGVDSSVVLRILADMPVHLHIVFMRNWDTLLSESSESSDDPPSQSLDLSYRPSGKGKHQCEWERDWDDVRRVALHAGIEEDRVRLVDFTKEYWTKVFEPAIGVWQGGATPNPDVDCNREIKFGSLLDSIPSSSSGGRHMLATGHYARVVRSSNGDELHRALDQTKDQSYYLSQVTSSQLARSTFPLGGIRKEDVRRLAKHYNLPTADRAESMGVCFIGERGKFGDFISQYTVPPERGYLVTPTGEKVGEHRGMWYYTIGQRARLSGMQAKWFVAKKGVGETGLDILVVPGADHPFMQCIEATTETFHWISGSPPDLVRLEGLKVQLRHRMNPVPADVKFGADGRSVVASFPTAITGVSPGQVLAVYHQERCLGSAVIRQTRTLGDELDTPITTSL